MATTPDPDLDLSAEAAAAGPIALTEIGGPKRPDITPAQWVASIPLVAEFGHAFGVYNLTQPQQDSLTHMVTWAIGLVGADALIRLGRNLANR